MEHRKNPHLETWTKLASRLNLVLAELNGQQDVGLRYDPKELPFVDEMKQLDEFVNYANEYEVAYESIVATVRVHGFSLSSQATLSLSEVATLLSGGSIDLEK